MGVVLVLTASLAVAGPWGRGGGMGPGSGMGHGFDMAPYSASNQNLTAEQSGKLQSLREAYLQEVTPL